MTWIGCALCATAAVCALTLLALGTAQPSQAQTPAAPCEPATNVAAIIDDSGSMSGTDPAAIRRRAIELLITKPSTADLTMGGVEFGSFATTLFAPGPLASEAERLRMLSSLAALQDDGSLEDDGGSTNYAAAFAISGLDQPDADARIFLTDGGHNEGVYGDDHAGGPPTYVIGLSIGPRSSSAEAALAARIAHKTGGKYFPLARRPKTKTRAELNRLQPAINRIDALLDCQALRKQTRQRFGKRGQVGRPTKTAFRQAGAIEIVASWSVPGCDVGLRSAVVTNRQGKIIADLGGKRRIKGSKRRRAKLSVNIVAGKTFETITVQRPKNGTHLVVRLGVQRIVKPAVVRTQVRAVPAGAPPGETDVAPGAPEAPPPEPEPELEPGPPPPKPLRKVITVYNMVTNGPTQMREDPVPARLTTKPWKFCGSRGCNINGTERVTGQKYDAAICWTTGDSTTNGDNTSPIDDSNPNRYTSDRYYGVRLTNGTFGYISWVWINAAHRGGLGLPPC
jgi:hypothetical protein